MYKKKNFSKSTIVNDPLLIDATSLTVATGEGTLFPDTGAGNTFVGVIFGSSYAAPASDPSREIVLAYRNSGDQFNITRGQEGTSAKQWESGDNFMLIASAAVLDEYETALGTKVAANEAIAGATKTKITYDAKGLVTAGSDATQDDIGDGVTNKQYSATEKTKLAGIEAGANNYTHPATHSADIITDGTTNKAYTATEKTKLAGIETSADVTDAGNVGSSINGASAKTSMVDADKIAIIDTEASNALKTLSWAYVKSILKTYFDSLYLLLSGGTLTGELNLGENAGIAHDNSLSADGKYSASELMGGTAGAALEFGDLCYFDPTDSRWEKTDANAAAGADGDARGLLGICVQAAAGDGNATKMMLKGFIRADAKFASMTINAMQYVSETAGLITETQPTTTDVVIRVVGRALTADVLYFNPSSDYGTHT